MFADMRGFMRISEQMEPDEVFPLLNEYFELLTRITLALPQGPDQARFIRQQRRGAWRQLGQCHQLR